MLAIAGFEFRTRMKRVSTYIYFAILATLAALWMAAAGGAFSSASINFGDKVFVNAPYALAQTITVLGLLGTVVMAAVMGRAVQQDFEHQTFHFFFTSPIGKHQYFIGRFLGAAATLVFIFLGITLGILVGAHWPGIDATRVGPWSLAAFVQPYLLMVLPNILFLGACFFGLAALGRRMLPVYIAGVVVLVGYLVAIRLLRDIDNRTLAALIDPIGSSALGLVTRYWSLAEKNSLLVPLADEVLWNRALWLGVGAVVFAFCYARFRMAFAQSERGEKVVERAVAKAPAAARAALPQVTLDVRSLSYLRLLPGMVALHLRETLKNVYFGVIVLTGVLFILGNAKVVGSQFGTNTYPVTYQVLDFASGSFGLFMLIITAFYAGELVWRERDARMAHITDSLPAPTWLSFAAKLLTLMTMQAVLQLVVLACGVLVQLFHGYTRLELPQYFYRLFALQLPDYWMIAALALAIHAVVNHKYLGHFLVVLYYVFEVTASAFGYDHRIYRFGSIPPMTYSDMNGYGHFLGPIRWFQLYWGAGAVLLLVVARLFWVRGADLDWKLRWRIARTRWTRPLAATAVGAFAVFAATGAWIFYNTDVLNTYRNEYQGEALQAQYERLYKPFAARPQPKIVATKIAVDIFPHQHRVRFAGTHTVKNKAAAAIEELYVGLPETAKVNKLDGSVGMRAVETRPELGWRRFALARALQPGETMTIDFDLEYPRPGFTNGGASSLVVDNGTFVNSGLLPALGYQERRELSQDNDRKKHGLAPRPRMPDLDDAAARSRNYISGDADWIDFEATVSTATDQIALAPGYLQREWVEGGRRHFHYKMDVPILNFYAFLSARYAVKRGTWSGGGKEVPIEVYYQPGHEYNVEAMIAAVKDSLDYYTRAFGPYQHRQVRILEFPRYATFAQAFPNTIPYSEGIGFIAKVDPKDPKDVDYPYYVTAHEIAHQWWAHQVIGANVQGATMLSETLSQYSALMVMKKKYGDAKMRRFLKYELDSYLRNRGSERKKELALYRNENQPYIHYRKGSLSMYALQDAIGEEAVNRALASYIGKVAYQEPPYTTTRELLAEFRAVTPPEHQYLIADLFESIVLYENRALSATWREKAGGRYEVTLKVMAKKVRADESGAQTDVPMDDLVDIGVLGDDDTPLYLQKHRVRSGESTFTLEVSGKPARAGIDPVVKLIDRRPDDNTVAASGG
jgi:ABC-type transport system involved in multi-copper enzyme maturation permease subunit